MLFKDCGRTDDDDDGRWVITIPHLSLRLRWAKKGYLLNFQTTEGSPGQTWQAGGGSFLLLPRRHSLSSRWLWTFNHNTCEKRLEEIQGVATSPLFMQSAMLHASETWPFTKPNPQHLKRNDRATRAGVCKTLCPQLPNTAWFQHCLPMMVRTVQIYKISMLFY